MSGLKENGLSTMWIAIKYVYKRKEKSMIKTLSLQINENPVCLIPDIIYSQSATYFGYTSKALKMHFVRLAEDGLGAEIGRASCRERV